jgi:hypothetical protein
MNAMKRIMKRIGVIGPVFIVAAAIAAVAAAPASSYFYGFKAAKYPAETKSKATNFHGFAITGAVSLCEEASFNTGPTESQGPNTPAANAKKPQFTLEVHPIYKKCFLSLAALANNNPAEVKTEGCNYVTHAVKPGLKTGEVDIKCEPGKEIEIKSLNIGECVIKTAPQTVKGISFTNVAGGRVLIESEVSNIKYTASSACGLGTLSGENGEYRKGELLAGNVAVLAASPAPAIVEAEALSSTKTFLESNVSLIEPHYYQEAVLNSSGARSIVSWGTIHLIATEGSPTGANAVCHNAAGGTIANPGSNVTSTLTSGLNGEAGTGFAQAFATFQCEQTNICPTGNDKSVRVEAPSEGTPHLPWKSVLTEDVKGIVRSETSEPRVVFHCTKLGVATTEIPYIVGKKKGSAEKELGQRPKAVEGTSALHPGFLEFDPGTPPPSGELEVEGSLGAVRAKTEGVVKNLGYEAQELINVSTP